TCSHISTKTLFVLALLALVVTSAVAQSDTTCSQEYGEQSEQCEQQQQQQWQKQMTPCMKFLQQQCSLVTLPLVQWRMWQLSNCHAMQQQCCKQLVQIPEQSRCEAIQSMAQAIMQPQDQPEIIRMALQTLPSMCSVHVPEYCTAIPRFDYYDYDS
ncbi:avenin-like b1, partial [Brachypodium distachyon]|uniref:avenin-like b1 n=1 Tax=Brachypodium distachyon TaxID=15368 RepID=UPI000D0DF7BF